MQVSGDIRSVLGGKIAPSTLQFRTDRNRPLDLLAVPSAVGVIGSVTPFFSFFSQPINPAAAIKAIKVANSSALINKSIFF